MLFTSQFNYTKKTKRLSAEISELNSDLVGSTLHIKSSHTGKIVKFAHTKTVEDKVEGEVLWAEYAPVNPADCPNVSLVIIFND